MFRLFWAAFAAFFVSACVSTSAGGDTFRADPKRTVTLDGPIMDNALDVARKLVDLAAEDASQPIDMVISSPGGSVYAGMQIMSAMSVAQARGTKIRCFVPLFAASMAFQVFAACDERFTLEYSLLLWHPATITTDQPLDAGTLEYEAEQMRAIERDLNKRLIAALGMDETTFYYHYTHETLWFAAELKRQAPGFLTIVQDFDNVNNPYAVSPEE